MKTQREKDIGRITGIVLKYILGMTHCPSGVVMGGIDTYADRYLNIQLIQEEKDKIYNDIKKGYEVAKGLR